MRTLANRDMRDDRDSFLPLSSFDDFDDAFHRLSRALGRGARSLDMRSDVHDVGTAYTMEIDEPGVKKEDIDVSISGRTVTVSTESSSCSVREGARSLQSERCVGESLRTFTLPAEMDAGRASASYQDGVLKLTLPKVEGSQPRHLQVA